MAISSRCPFGDIFAVAQLLYYGVYAVFADYVYESVGKMIHIDLHAVFARPIMFTSLLVRIKIRTRNWNCN
jgi:hypothetical protein